MSLYESDSALFTQAYPSCLHTNPTNLRRSLAFAPRKTKEVAYKLLVRPKLGYAAPIWSPYCLNSGSTKYVCWGRQPAGHAGRRSTRSVGEMLDELQWPTLEAQSDQSSLLLFLKFHCETMSIDKDKYLTPSHSTRFTRSSQNSQYYRPKAYSEVLKLAFFPIPFPSPRCREEETQNTESHGTINVNQQAFFPPARCYIANLNGKMERTPRTTPQTTTLHKTIAFNGSNSKQCINKNIITPSIGQQPPGGYSYFFRIRRLGPTIYRSPPKNIRNFKHPKKIFEILATQKISQFVSWP